MSSTREPPRQTCRSLHSIAARAYGDVKTGVKPLSPDIVRSAVFTADSAAQHATLFQTEADTFYQRFGHPSERPLAEKLAALEGGESAALFSSGIAAIATSLIAHLPPGSHIVAGAQIFDQTESIIRWLAAGRGVEADFVDTRDVDLVARALRPNTRLIYIETPSNPTLRISDIEGIAGIARARRALLFVDSTFATPFAQQPLSLGASLVLHSATKLLNGHMDAMCGAAIGSYEVLKPILAFRRLLGAVLDPSASWLVQRGLRTLSVRTERVFASALAVANDLLGRSEVAAVHYPFLPAHRNHEVARRQMSAGGGVISFSLHGGRDTARRFMNSLQFIQIATSLGGVETTIELPYDLDWVGKQPSPGAETDAGLIRLSVGLEDVREIIADIDQALKEA